MRENRLLAAVVPFHDFENNFPYLRDLIQSVSSAVEIIIVCDSIQPQDFKTVQTTFAGYSNIILLNENFRSAGKSRNVGLQKSSSPWVVFWDCDDKVNSYRYLDLVRSSNSGNSDLLVGQIQTFDSHHGDPLTVSRTRNVSDLATYPAFTRVIYRRTFIADDSFPEIPQGEDQCFLAKLLAKNPNIEFFPDVLYFYRVNNANQTSNKSFDYSSHFEALQMLSELLRITEFGLPRKTILIFRFRILVSSMKRVRGANHLVRPQIVKKFLVAVIRSPWLLWFIRPRTVSAPPETFLPKLILVGGLGNQIFQYVYMINRFGKGNFQVNANLGKPRVSADGSPEIYAFSISEKLISTDSLLKFKSFVCKYLLILSSHGNVDPISRAAFLLIHVANKIHAFFNNGVGLVFLANGVGYFEDYSKQSSYKYFIGCFHSYKWQDCQNIGSDSFRFELKVRPHWLDKILDESKHTRFGVVHIRRGDYTDISNLGFLKMKYFQEHMVAAYKSNQVDEFLIFSDDPNYVRSNLSDDISTNCRFIDFDQENASANLVAMTAGRFFILSNSTFSWWGASMSPFKEKTVIAPKSWFADNSTPREIYPVDWILKDVAR